MPVSPGHTKAEAFKARSATSAMISIWLPPISALPTKLPARDSGSVASPPRPPHTEGGVFLASIAGIENLPLEQHLLIQAAVQSGDPEKETLDSCAPGGLRTSSRLRPLRPRPRPNVESGAFCLSDRSAIGMPALRLKPPLRRPQLSGQIPRTRNRRRPRSSTGRPSARPETN